MNRHGYSDLELTSPTASITMNRFAMFNFSTICVVVLLAFAGASSAAPIPRDAGKGDSTPDLKLFFETVSKAVKDEKWPAEADEKKLTNTTRIAFERMLKAAGEKERQLPVDFSKLLKEDAVKEFKTRPLNERFLIAETVRTATARDSIIYASGDVQITNASNCIIVGKNVRCTVASNCVIIAGEYLRVLSSRRRNNEDGSVLLAGQWIRATSMAGTICHVIRPTGLPNPDDARVPGDGPHPAIRTNTAENVIFLNDQDQTRASGAKDCNYSPQKNQIVK